MSALLYMLRAGCPWRDLPDQGVHWRTIYGYFAQWRDAGVWQTILQTLTQGSRGPMFCVDSTYVPRPEFRPATRFERRGERLGHGVWDLAYLRG